jgi:hypothetical protein
MSKLVSALGIVTLSAALAYGVVAWRQPRPSQTAWTEAVAVAQQLQDRALQTYRSGASEQAIPALRAYLQYLEDRAPLGDEWKVGQSPWLDVRELAAERMLVAGRLASMIEQSPDPSEATGLWERALSYAHASGRPDVSIDSVRDAISRSAPLSDGPDLERGQTR